MVNQPNMTPGRYRLFRFSAFWIGFVAYVISARLDDPTSIGLLRYLFYACMGAGVISFPIEFVARRRVERT